MKDKLNREEIEVVYCPTKKIVADFFTKPLQGSQFRFLRRIVLGMDPMSSLDLFLPAAPSLKERIGKHGKHGSPESHSSPVKEGGRQQQRTYASVVTGQ